MIWIKCIFGILILEAITCLPAISHEKNIRVQRSIPGGVVVEDPNDPKYLELAKEALKRVKDGSNQDYVVSKVTKVTEQVVAGLLTEIDYEIKPTSCPSSSHSCATKNCHSKVLEQAWLNNTEFTTDCDLV